MYGQVAGYSNELSTGAENVNRHKICCSSVASHPDLFGRENFPSI